MYKSLSLIAMLLASSAINAAQSPLLSAKRVSSEGSPRLQALAINNNGDIWASGTKGQVVMSADNGQNWRDITVPDSEKLQFRDIWVGDNTVYLLAAGSGSDSRLYRSSDNGLNWDLQYTMKDPKGFINCFDFWDKDHGIVFGDTIDQQVFMLQTDDGGDSWQRIESAPIANDGGEGGFSASGSCVRVLGNNEAWLTTGATATARLLRTKDRGETWSSTPLPFPNSTTGGIFSAIPKSNWLFGGQMKPAIVSAWHKEDGHWQSISNVPLKGAIYGSDSFKKNIVVVNPDGVALSQDNGKSWQRISSQSYWVVEFDQHGVAWLAGPGSRISRLF